MKGLTEVGLFPVGNGAGTRGGARYLLYSYDSLTLGHLQRNFKIASALVQDEPDSTVLLLTSSPHGLDRRLPPGVDFLKLPTIAGNRNDGFELVSLRVSDPEVIELRAGVIQRAVELFEPDVLLVDHLPVGAAGELVPTLEMCRRLQRPATVLGLRDIIGAPEDLYSESSVERAGDTIERYYDRVLIYGAEDIHPLAARCGLVDRIPDKVAYCGYVTPASGVPDREHAREELGLETTDLIVITGGGGVDAYDTLERWIAALRKLARNDCRAIALAGPMMRNADRTTLRRLVRGTEIEIWDQVTDPLALFCAADLVLTMGGYNTLVEAVTAGTRVLVMPRLWHMNRRESGRRLGVGATAVPQDREQLLRAQAFEERGLAKLVPADADDTEVAKLIADELGLPRPAGGGLPDGLLRVQHELRALIDQQRVPLVAG